MSVRFLLIPDLHFGAPEQIGSEPFRAGESEADWLVSAYKRMPERWSPDVILATGDLTTKVDQVGFTAAKGFFTRLKEEFPDAALFITPGNHDVAALDSKPGTLAPFYPTVQPDAAYERFFDTTSALLTSPDVASGEHLASFLHVIHSDSESPPVCLMGLNSSRLERPACIGLGYVGVDQFSALLLGGLKAPLRDYYESGRPIFGLAATHFHPLPQSLPAGQQFHEGFPELYKRLQRCTVSFLTDSSQLLGALADARFTVLAHGHSHQPPCARRVFGYSLDPGRPINQWGDTDTPDRESPLHVIDGGHFRPDGTSGLRHFALFDFVRQNGNSSNTVEVPRAGEVRQAVTSVRGRPDHCRSFCGLGAIKSGVQDSTYHRTTQCSAAPVQVIPQTCRSRSPRLSSPPGWSGP